MRTNPLYIWLILVVLLLTGALLSKENCLKTEKSLVLSNKLLDIDRPSIIEGNHPGGL